MAESSSEARDAAAEAAISYLTLSNTVSAYWQTRILLDLVSKSSSVAKQEPRVTVMDNSFTSRTQLHVPASPFSMKTTQKPVDNENLICSICGIVTTSVAHLKEHQKGRRHMKNLARLQEQQKANMPQAKARNSHLVEESNSYPGIPNDLDIIQHNGVSTTIEKLPSTLSDVMARRNSQPLRQGSNVYESFPCVKVGEYALPSSMDLRAFLEEMESKEEDASEQNVGILGEKSPLERKKSPKQTPRNHSHHSTPRHKPGRQRTRDNGKAWNSPRNEQYPYPISHDFVSNYGVVNDGYHNNVGMYQYHPVQYVPYIPQPGMVPAQMLQPVASNHILPAYFQNVMLPNHEMMRDYDQSTRPRQHWRQPPRNTRDHYNNNNNNNRN